jgi:LPXTG-motif cell wall-anchored protein
MKHLVLLASIYALIVALVVPGSILAQDEPAPAVTETTPAEPAPAPAEPAPAEPAPAEAAPAPAQAAPAPAAAPEPQFLADERAEAPDPQPKAIAAASGSVTIADFSFTPGTITINQGDTVTWSNNGPTPHSAKANDGSFDTGILKKGQSGSHTFKEAGTFSYFCQPHPFMKATVVVQAASESGGGDTGGSGSADTGGTDNTGGTSADAAQSDEGPTLPDTGSDSGALLFLGALMLVLGAAIHRRTAASDPRPAGRIGW